MQTVANKPKTFIFEATHIRTKQQQWFEINAYSKQSAIHAAKKTVSGMWAIAVVDEK